MSLRLGSCAVLVVLALAGCSDGPGPAQDEDPFADIPVDAPASGKGLIRGLVIDEAIVPVADATITVTGLGLETQSNEQGAFVFNNLDPATYFLQITKPGFDGVQQSAVVEAGVAAPDIVKVLLIRAPGTEPYFVPSHYQGYISCALLVANRLFGPELCDPTGATFGEDDATPFFAVDARPATFLQIEVQWEENQPGGDRLTVTAYACDLQGDCDGSAGSSQRVCQVWGASPHVCRVSSDAGTGNPDGTGGGNGLDEAAFGSGTEPGFRVWTAADCAEILCVPGTALGVGVVIEQTFDVYNHVFYNFAPPEDWIFVRDGPPAGP